LTRCLEVDAVGGEIHDVVAGLTQGAIECRGAAEGDGVACEFQRAGRVAIGGPCEGKGVVAVEAGGAGAEDSAALEARVCCG